MTPGYRIEAARVEDLAVLPAIEVEAAQIFPRDIASPELFAESLSPATFEAAQREGRLFVAIDEASGGPVGFALAIELGGEGHLHEVDVSPAHGQKGLGRALVLRVAEWARSRGFAGLTLTTFRDVAWNAPFYASLGFEPLERAAMSDALAAQFDDEASDGLDPATRVAMRLRLG